MTAAWRIDGPVGARAYARVLRPGFRTVLVVVPFVVAGTRLMDVLPLLEADHRIVALFTAAPSSSGAVWHDTERFLQAQGGLVLPWQQALDTQFDLVLAASDVAVDQVNGPVMLLPHGASALMSRLRARTATAHTPPAHGLDREYLVRGGRVVPTALVLSHESELLALRRSCPEALPAAVVAGDICYDRLAASLPYREHYRRALGVRPGQKLVTVTTTWRPESAFGEHADLFDWLLAELPRDDYQVAAILHPNIWSIHGRWQVRAWLADAMRAGLRVLPPEEGWRGALAAADWIIGDHGSVTQYGATVGAPVLLAALPEHDVRAGSLADAVGHGASRLRRDVPLLEQLRAASVTNRPGWHREIAARITSQPGRAGALLRQAMYRILGLSEPERAVPVAPVPLPVPIEPPPSIGPPAGS
jgi:hypothetical protein